MGVMDLKLVSYGLESITRIMQGIDGEKPSPACSLNWNTVYVRDETYNYLAFAPAESLVWAFTPIIERGKGTHSLIEISVIYII